MNIMDAMGDAARTSSGLAPAGDLAGMDVGADSETLALFASLFAMMQGPQPDDAAVLQDGVEAASQAKSDPAAQTPLPAAAMLMAARGLGSSPASGLPNDDIVGARDRTAKAAVAGDAAHLVRLLLTARDITMPDGATLDGAIPDGAMPNEGVPAQIASDQGLVPVGTSKTATEMLTGAIEILRSLDAVGTTQDVAADKPDITEVMTRLSPEVVGPMPVVTAQAVTMPAVTMQALAAPSADFVGPMPAVTMPAVTMQALAAPSADFVGPMPAVMMPAVTMQALAAPSADFVGPMPAVTMPAVTMPAVTMPAVTMQALAAPSAEFVGPMPAAVLVPAGSRLANVAHPATVHIPGGQAGSGQADGLSSPILADADALEGAEGELVRADMVIARKAGQTVNGGRELFANNMDGQPGKGPRQMTETPAGASHNMAAALKQAAAQGASQILSHMPAKQAHQTAQPAPSTTDTAGQSHAGQTGGQSGGQTGGQSGGHSSAQQMADAGSARGTADRTMLHRLNTETAGWSEAMVKRLTSDLRAGVRNVRMILEPRHLGRLNVELGLRNGRASIRIAAETGEAARLLSGARGQLGQMLENSGMRLASFHASGSGAETSSDSGHGANAHAGQDGGKNAGRNQGFSNKMTNEAAGRREDEALRGLPDDALRAGETAVLSILA